MKKSIKLLSFVILTYFLLLGSVSAASLSLSKSSNSVSSGGTVKITARVSGATSYTYSNFSVNYDQSKFSFVGASDNCNGLNCLVEGNGSVTLTFKATGSGSGSFSASGSFEDDSSGSLSASTSVSIGGSSSNDSSNKSLNSNNYLKSLSIEGQSLNPKFSKDTLEYNVTLASSVETIKIVAEAEQKTSKVTGIGEVKVSEGLNNIEVVVTAENGNKKTYTIKATIEEKNPVKVDIGDSIYTLVTNKDNLTKPENYEEKTIKIQDKEVPAFYSEITKFTLVGLKDKDGKINLYIYNEKTKEYSLYQEVKSNALTIYPMKLKKVFKGYKKFSIDINGIKVEALKLDEDSNYAIIYGMDVETGKKNYYMYDIDNNTFQRYNDEHVKMLYKEEKILAYVVLGSWGMLLLFIIITIVLAVKNSKRKKKIRLILERIANGELEEDNQEDIVDEEKIVDEVIDEQEEDEEEMYSLFEEDKKRSKKKSRK